MCACSLIRVMKVAWSSQVFPASVKIVNYVSCVASSSLIHVRTGILLLARLLECTTHKIEWSLFVQKATLESICRVYVSSAAGFSLVPRPRPAFRCLQYGKAGRAWYLFSREHDVIGKWRKFSEQTGCVLRIVQLTTHSMLGVYDNRPPLARYVQ